MHIIPCMVKPGMYFNFFLMPEAKSEMLQFSFEGFLGQGSQAVDISLVEICHLVC